MTIMCDVPFSNYHQTGIVNTMAGGYLLEDGETSSNSGSEKEGDGEDKNKN
jgi:arabinogalactan endo-1,4-beta-galactosidase